MSDSSATLLAYLISLAVMLGYGIRIAMLRRGIQKHAAPRQAASIAPPKEDVVRELKPASKIKIS